MGEATHANEANISVPNFPQRVLHHSFLFNDIVINDAAFSKLDLEISSLQHSRILECTLWKSESFHKKITL